MVTLTEAECAQVLSLIQIAWGARAVGSEGMAYDLIALKAKIAEALKTPKPAEEAAK